MKTSKTKYPSQRLMFHMSTGVLGTHNQRIINIFMVLRTRIFSYHRSLYLQHAARRTLCRVTETLFRYIHCIKGNAFMS